VNRSQRELGLVVVAGVAGAALALHSARALALVALAAAGALFATRGWGRRIVAALQVLSGVGIVVTSVVGAVTVGGGSGGTRTGDGALWLAATVTGGLLVVAAGVSTVLRGQAWASLGSRYERPGGTTADDPRQQVGSDDRTDASDQVDGQIGGTDEVPSERWWDAIERGDDPTKG
jgi:uncharacterized membrane protein (TIGR02234 family)